MIQYPFIIIFVNALLKLDKKTHTSQLLLVIYILQACSPHPLSHISNPKTLLCLLLIIYCSVVVKRFISHNTQHKQR